MIHGDEDVSARRAQRPARESWCLHAMAGPAASPCRCPGTRPLVQALEATFRADAALSALRGAEDHRLGIAAKNPACASASASGCWRTTSERSTPGATLEAAVAAFGLVADGVVVHEPRPIERTRDRPLRLVHLPVQLIFASSVPRKWAMARWKPIGGSVRASPRCNVRPRHVGTWHLAGRATRHRASPP